MLCLPRNLGKLAGLAAEAPGHYSLTAVRLEATPKGYRVEVTDGRRLARVEGASLAPGNASPPVASVADASDGQASVLVPAQAWADYFDNIAEAAGGNGRQYAVASMGEDMTTLATVDRGRMNTRQIPNLCGPYPNTDDAIPTGEPVAVVRLDARWLRELLEVAAAFADAGGGRAVVALEVRMPQRLAGRDGLTPAPLVLRAKNRTLSQEFTGLLMPLV
jgi:hypothetical protein